MARRRAPYVRRAGGGGTDNTDIVVVQSPPPVQVRRRSSSPARRRRSRGRRRSSAGGTSAGSVRNRLIGAAIGGAGYGFLTKQWPNMPQLPVLGRAGTVAVAIGIWNPKSQLVRDIGLAAAAIAGYGLGSTGQVSGDYDGAHGLAAEL